MIRLVSTLIGAAALALSLQAHAALITFIVPLQGTQEVNANGDPDGFGIALLAIDDVALTISWNLVVRNIDLPPTGAHIHNALAGSNGPVLIDFNGQLSGTGVADADLAAVLANPESFYVNVHNAPFPGGAIRGQLGGTQAPSTFTSFTVSLDGAQEVNGLGVPNQGDPDGSGTALLAIEAATSTINWLIVANNIDLPPIGAHIHNAPAGANGPIRIDFDGQLIGAGVVDADVAAVLASPANFYVNVHNAPYPTGAIRGQLTEAATPVPEPATLLLLIAGLGSLVVARRRYASRWQPNGGSHKSPFGP